MEHIKEFKSFNEGKEDVMSILSQLDDWVHENLKKGNKSEVESIFNTLETSMRLYRKKHNLK